MNLNVYIPYSLETISNISLYISIALCSDFRSRQYFAINVTVMASRTNIVCCLSQRARYGWKICHTGNIMTVFKYMWAALKKMQNMDFFNRNVLRIALQKKIQCVELEENILHSKY